MTFADLWENCSKWHYNSVHKHWSLHFLSPDLQLLLTHSVTARETDHRWSAWAKQREQFIRKTTGETDGQKATSPNPVPEQEDDLRTVPNSGRRDTVTPRSNQESKQEKLRNRDKAGVRQGPVLRGDSGERGHAMGAGSQVSETDASNLQASERSESESTEWVELQRRQSKENEMGGNFKIK